MKVVITVISIAIGVISFYCVLGLPVVIGVYRWDHERLWITHPILAAVIGAVALPYIYLVVYLPVWAGFGAHQILSSWYFKTALRGWPLRSRSRIGR